MADLTKFPIPTRTFNFNDFNLKYSQTVTKAGEAEASATAAADDAAQTAADRVQTGLDATAAEASATAAADDAAQTAADRIATGQDRVATGEDVVEAAASATAAASSAAEVALQGKGRAPDDAATVPEKTDSEPIAVSNDGYQVLRREGDVLFLGNMPVELDGELSAFDLKTDDGYIWLRVSQDGTLHMAGAEYTLDPFSQHRIQTADGETLLDFDAQSGGARLVLSPDRFDIGGRPAAIAGVVSIGQVSDVRASGDWFAYHVSGADYSGKVIGRADIGDFAAPHIADAPVYDVIEADGQSWQTISSYNPGDIDNEETSGDTSAAVRLSMTPMVSVLRKDNFLTPQPDGEFAGQLPSVSNGSRAGDLWRMNPSYRYSIAQMAAICRARFQHRFGLAANPSIMLQVGWPGTPGDQFLPEGASRAYTDDDGNPQTLTATEHPAAGHYLWADNIERRQSLADVIAEKWFGRPLNYEFVTWIQGPFDDSGEQTSFMTEYRAQQDALTIPSQSGTRHILWDQRARKTNQTLMGFGDQSQVDFCLTNASGKDWMVGPRYPHYFYDTIHHSSFGALEYAERTAQAMAYIQKYGSWVPLWITGVTFSGADATITTSQPRQCVGDLGTDTDAITAVADGNHGFTLWDADLDTQITINSVAISGNTITLTAASTLSGNVEVGYAARGPATRTAGTVATPNHSAVWGNIKMVGRDAPAVIPATVQPTLDHWLCAHRKIYAV